MVTSPRAEWVLLTYRLPREPSAPRLAVWRAIRRLGAHQLGDGLVALPHSARNLEHLEWLAAGITEHDGSATVWRARPETTDDHEAMAASMRDSAEREYRAVLDEAETALEAAPGPGELRRVVRRLRAHLRRIRLRDYFDAPSGPAARAAVDRLAGTRQAVPA